MTDLGPYPDARAAVIDVLDDLVASAIAGPCTLASILAATMPVITVRRTGGGDDGVTDTSDIALAVYAGDPDTAWTVVQACHQRLTSLRLAGNDQGTSACLIHHVGVSQSPLMATASDVEGTQLARATYEIDMRRTAA